MRNKFYILIFTFLITNIQLSFTQNQESKKKTVNAEVKAIVSIAVFTAKGNLPQLNKAMHEGLNVGLTQNQIKEILVHSYAYCGFPRSIRALQTFMDVLEERKAKGIQDVIGKEASVMDSQLPKYERGKLILEKLTQTPAPKALTGYGAFAPIMDTFLKEHLFADIFERDVLTYAQREWITISVIAAIGDAEPMLKAHYQIALNTGITPPQLKDFIFRIQKTIGVKAAKAAQVTLNQVLNQTQKN